MDIMLRLKGAGFSTIANAFREREKRLKSGLPLVDFVDIVLLNLPLSKTREEKVAIVSALIDLFEEIDINGDGRMEFNEFTSFCVDAGMIASRTQGTVTLKHRYERNVKHALKTTAYPRLLSKAHESTGLNPLNTEIHTLKWSAEFQLFLVLEKAAQAVKVFTGHGNFVTHVNVASAKGCQPSFATIASRNGTGKLKTPVARVDDYVAVPPLQSSSVSILDAVFIHRFLWLGVSTTDCGISFYELVESRKVSVPCTTPPSRTFKWLPHAGLTTTTAQRMLRFCDSSALLLGSGNDLTVNVWKLLDNETQVLVHRLSGHLDLLMDALEIPVHDLLATCDLRHGIQLWNLSDGRTRGPLVAHDRGVRQLCYSKQHDLLLSAGFDYNAFAWDLASRQVVVELSGHRAPLVGLQLATFQSERAITADCQGVFKVWDISRGNAKSTNASISQAVQLETFHVGTSSTPMEPVAFVSMYPHSRDLWVAASNSCTLQRLDSVRVQQLDEVPLRAFYHSLVNQFIVVSGSVCSLWDGETGCCSNEVTRVETREKDTGISDSTSRKEARKSWSESHSAACLAPPSHLAPSVSKASVLGQNEAGFDVLICANDVKCRKLAVMSEQGTLSVLNCQNFVQLRQCNESFLSSTRASRPTLSAKKGPDGTLAKSCAVVGLHYCSDNKLVIVADAGTSAITVIDDSSSQDLSNGMVILRRLSNIPGSISASAYSFHASMVATVAVDSDSVKIALWDFETLAHVGNCDFDNEDDALRGASGWSIQKLEFWSELPILLASDACGGVYFFAVRPLPHARTGKLLHAFINRDHVENAQQKEVHRTIDETVDVESKRRQRKAEEGLKKVVARKVSAKRLQKYYLSPTSMIEPPPVPCTLLAASVVTCMKMVVDEERDRYLLFIGDDQGNVGIWDPSPMVQRLALAKIAKKKCRHLRRGYQPKAMFQRSYLEKPLSRDGSEMKQRVGHRQSMRRDCAGGTTTPFLPENDTMRRNARTSDHKSKLRHRKLSRGLHSPQSPRRTSLAHVHVKESTAANVVAAAEFLRCKGKASTFAKHRPLSSRTASKSFKAWPGKTCYERFPQDVMLVRRWQAHTDAVTSLEISHHPNIVVTCGLDMCVFVWNWEGACLGKLFDPENQGPWPWRFQKDSAMRTTARENLVDKLLQQIERTATEKIKVRRQTLYAEQVDRATSNKGRQVNALLLEHVISKNSEIKLLELEMQAETKETSNNIKLREVQDTSPPTLATQVTSAPTLTTPRQLLRLQSLNQLGLRVQARRSGHKGAHRTMDQIAFLEVEDLKMDKTYLETELSITCPVASSRGRRPTRDAAIRQQTQQEYKVAQETIATRAKLARKAREMYSNMEVVLSKHRKHRPDGEDHDLEASNFLKQHFPPSVLAGRPQTAPTRSLKKSASSRDVASYHARKTTVQQLQVSASESLLPTKKDASFQQSISRMLKVDKCRRRSSLDDVFTEETYCYRQDRTLYQKTNETMESDGSLQEPRSFCKLREINDIIDKVHTYCKQDCASTRPCTAPTIRQRSRVLLGSSEQIHNELSNGTTRKVEVLRQHLERTKRRMNEALRAHELRPNYTTNAKTDAIANLHLKVPKA